MGKNKAFLALIFMSLAICSTSQLTSCADPTHIPLNVTALNGANALVCVTADQIVDNCATHTSDANYASAFLDASNDGIICTVCETTHFLGDTFTSITVPNKVVGQCISKTI